MCSAPFAHMRIINTYSSNDTEKLWPAITLFLLDYIEIKLISRHMWIHLLIKLSIKISSCSTKIYLLNYEVFLLWINEYSKITIESYLLFNILFIYSCS